MKKQEKEIPVAEAVAAISSEQVADVNVVAAPDNGAESEAEIVVFPAAENVAANVTATDKFDKEAAELFASYPDNTAFYFTNDGLAFFQQNDARNHASSLEDKEVITKVRK